MSKQMEPLSVKRIGVLDADSTMTFHTHKELLDSCFGRHSNLQKATQVINDHCRVWMPKFIKDRHGNPVKVKSNWINDISEEGDIIVTIAPGPVPLENILPPDYITLVFGMMGRTGDYKFLGAYIPDLTNSTNQKHVSRRIAKKVELIGNPVTEVKMLDSTFSKGIITKKMLEGLQELEKKQAEGMSLAALKKTARANSTDKPGSREVNSTVIIRDPYVSEYVKRLANGKCDLCNQAAPFKDKNGKPYLETHHVVWLSNGGSDSIENAVALCPNCHRKMHIVNNKTDVEMLLETGKRNALESQ